MREILRGAGQDIPQDVTPVREIPQTASHTCRMVRQRGALPRSGATNMAMKSGRQDLERAR